MDRVVTLYNEEERRYSLSPVKVRGTPAYERQVRRKIRRIADYVVSRDVALQFVTFSAWAPEGLSPWEMLQRWDGFVNSFFSWLQAKTGVRYHYIWAIEPTKRGYCHIHLILLDCEHLDYDAVFAWWYSQPVGYGSNHHALRIDRVAPNGEQYAKVVGYLTKYLSKSYTDPFWSGLLALTRRREWGCSNRLMELVEEWEESTGVRPSWSVKTNSKWKCYGLLDRLLVESILDARKGDVPLPADLVSEIYSIKGVARSIMDLHFDDRGGRR